LIDAQGAPRAAQWGPEKAALVHLHNAHPLRVAGCRLDLPIISGMPGLLIIAHAPLASALKAVATHTYPDCAALLEVLDVTPGMSPEEIEHRARALLQRVGNPDAIIFTDVCGATPCNVAQRLAAQAEGGQVKVISGVNVPMLWRSLCYAGEALDVVAARAVSGAVQGVMNLSVSKPQNQAHKPMTHDQDSHQHQQ